MHRHLILKNSYLDEIPVFFFGFKMEWVQDGMGKNLFCSRHLLPIPSVPKKKKMGL